MRAARAAAPCRALAPIRSDVAVDGQNGSRPIFGKDFHRGTATLTVLLAREAPSGVVMVRAAKKWTQLVTWDTRSDTFTKGQWLRGHVYRRRCDLSPSGRVFSYFVNKMRWPIGDDFCMHTFTAVCRPPYWTALALWPNGGSTIAGGALFASEDHVLLNQAMFDGPHDAHRPPRWLRVEPIGVDGDSLFARRLTRDGWQLVSARRDTFEEVVGGRLERRSDRCGIRLDFASGRLAYSLLDGGMERSDNPLAGATWADFDDRQRLVFAKDGQLFAITDLAASPVRIADFRDCVPVSVETPDEAKRWDPPSR